MRKCEHWEVDIPEWEHRSRGVCNFRDSSQTLTNSQIEQYATFVLVVRRWRIHKLYTYDTETRISQNDDLRKENKKWVTQD